jgi:hypothetical protein
MRIRRIFVVNGFDRKEAMQFQGKSFSGWINDHLHQIGLPSVEISQRTATRWFHQFNYHIGDASKKGMYLDGHERPEVVEYRKKFLDEMEVYQHRIVVTSAASEVFPWKSGTNPEDQQEREKQKASACPWCADPNRAASHRVYYVP